MHLHYIVKLKIRIFCENCNAEKVKLKKSYLFTLILLILKDAMNVSTLTSSYGKFN